MSSDAIALRIGAFLLAAALFAVAGSLQADPNWRQNGNSNAAQSARSGGECVRETDWMRRNHMALMKHDRDATVIHGVRTIDGSLAECIACHANRDEQGHYVPVTASGEFCAGCHEFTGVALNCFQCHATVPSSNGTGGQVK
jgi:hypothetical protein